MPPTPSSDRLALILAMGAIVVGLAHDWSEQSNEYLTNQHASATIATTEEFKPVFDRTLPERVCIRYLDNQARGSESYATKHSFAQYAFAPHVLTEDPAPEWAIGWWTFPATAPQPEGFQRLEPEVDTQRGLVLYRVRTQP